MSRFLRELAMCFAAGAAGGLASSVFLWLLGWAGVTPALGVAIVPELTPAWIYPRVVWGGIWGGVFLLSLPVTRPLRDGLAWSLAPSAVALFVVFPYVAGKGMAGLDLGLLTPVVVLLANGVWGLTAAGLLARMTAPTSLFR